MDLRKPKAYSYTRMSTPEQLKGDSRRRQEERANRYAEEHGLEIVDRFDDFGVSAFKGKNAELGALSEFTRLVDNGAIEAGSYLLVESMDRLTRQSVPRAMSLLLGLTDRGICVAILDDNKVYSERSNEEDTFALMSALVSMSRAHEESRRKSTMIAEAWKNKRALARRDGKVTTSKVPGWLKVEEGKVQEIPERVKIVREIFELTRGGYGAYSIAKRLNERDERPWSNRTNAVWRESYVKKILKSRTVLGEYQPHLVTTINGKVERVPDGEPLRGYYPEIVSLVLYQEANAAIDRRRVNGKGRKGARYANIFTGLLRCQCGAGYRYIDKGSPPKGGSYLQCSVSFSKGRCKARAIRYDVLDGFDGMCNQAMHLITTKPPIATIKQNFNFIFSNDEDRYAQWEQMYRYLPLLLFYATEVVESLVTVIGKRPMQDYRRATIQRSIGFVAWARDVVQWDENAVPADEDYDAGIECPGCAAEVPPGRDQLMMLIYDGQVSCPHCSLEFGLDELAGGETG